MRVALGAALALAGLSLLAPAPAGAARAPRVVETSIADVGGPLARDGQGGLWVLQPGSSQLQRLGNGGFLGVANPAAERLSSGPDGAVWYLDASGGLVRVAPNGSSTLVATIAGDPTDVVTGPDGNLWVTSAGDGTTAPGIVRVTPGGTEQRFPLPAGVVPRTPVAGTDGGVWFVDAGSAVGILRIDAATGDLTRYPLGGAAPKDLAWGEDGLWFTRPQGAVGRMTADGRVALFTGDLGATPLSAIAAGPDGAMWFTGDDLFGRVDLDGDLDVYRDQVGSSPMGADLLPDAAFLWLSFTDRNSVARISVPPVTKADAAAVDSQSIRVVAPVPAGWGAASYVVQLRRPEGAWTTALTPGVPSGPTVGGVVGGLTPDTLYQLRVLGTGDAGVTRSKVLTVRTQPAPAGPPEAAPVHGAAPPAPAEKPAAPAPAPKPAVGKTVVVKADSGTVKVKVPGKGFVPVDDASTIPVKAVVDATAGSVALTSQLADGTTQVGHFSGGQFRVHQSKARGGMTRIVLAGKLDCGPTSHALAQTARKKRKRRQVWGKDDGGNFQTNGRESVATVRGTRWLTRDTCKGTLVKVVQGVVDVRDKDTGRTVRVRAGKSRFTPGR